MRKVAVNARRLPVLWSIAIVLPLGVIFYYAARWTLRRPDATDVDRAIFIASCATVVLLLVASKVVRDRQRTAARRAAGQCVKCGYDLRASPERCPECGRQIQERAREG